MTDELGPATKQEVRKVLDGIEEVAGIGLRFRAFRILETLEWDKRLPGKRR